MTIEEKLQHFHDTTVEEARNQAYQELEIHRKNLDKMLAEHKKTRTQDAQAEIKAETQNAQREVNKALSAQQLTLKRNWNARQNELKEKNRISCTRFRRTFYGRHQGYDSRQKYPDR